MGLKHLATRAVLSAFPLESGLWRVKKYLPEPPDRPYAVRKLRGFPLRMKFKPRTYVGWFLYYRGIYEQDTIRQLAELLRPGMTFVDVGANYGLYTVIPAWKVGPEGRVLAFEPQPDLAELVRENAAMNRLENVTVEACAIGRENGMGELVRPSRTNDGAATLKVAAGEKTFGEALPVPVRPLSAVLAERGIERVDGMKIDVEGAETEVLRGCESVLSGLSPPEFILLEVIDQFLKRFGSSTAELFGLLRSHGYRIAESHVGAWSEVRGDVATSPDVLAVRPGTPTWATTKHFWLDL